MWISRQDNSIKVQQPKCGLEGITPSLGRKITTGQTGYQEKPWEECEKCLRLAVIENLM
jgi:hypothetical protein